MAKHILVESCVDCPHIVKSKPFYIHELYRCRITKESFYVEEATTKVGDKCPLPEAVSVDE